MPLSIAYLAPWAMPARTANAVHVARISQALARQGHTVTLFAFRSPLERHSSMTMEGLLGEAPLFRLDSPLRTRGGFLDRLRYYQGMNQRFAQHGPVDLIWSRNLWASSALLGTGTSFIYEPHHPPRSPFEIVLERRLLRHPMCRKVVVISDALLTNYRLRHPDIEPERFFLARDAADPLVPHDLSPCQESLEDGAVLNAGYFGSLGPGRGVPLILDLASRLPHIRFRVAGGTDTELEGVLARNGLSRSALPPNLSLSSFLDQNELADWMARTDVVLAPYTDEAEAVGGERIAKWISPLKLFEGYVNGKVILASDLPALREVISDGLDGILLPPGDAAAWELELRRLSSSPGLVRRLKEAALIRGREEFTWERRVERVLASVGFEVEAVT